MSPINVMAKKVPFPPEYKAQLGVLSDKDLSKLTGRSVAYVAKCRKEKGLDSPTSRRRHDWTAEEESLLGTDTDANIGKRIGICTTSVSIRRRIKGIPAFGKHSTESVAA